MKRMDQSVEKVKTWYAESLGEVYQHVNAISEEIKSETKDTPILWFRGHARANYHLEPNIFRQVGYRYNDTDTYSNNHLREEYRFQSFMSRNFDKVDYHVPQTMIEWQEVMQHFFSRTRLMDWSESLVIALEFALESFISPVKDLEVIERCRTAEPVIWILQPTRLNEAVYHSFVDKADSHLIKKALNGERTDKLADEILRELQKDKAIDIYFDTKVEQEKNLNKIIGLSALEMVRNAYKGREMAALSNLELNPFFYLLLRYYSDGIPVKLGDIPPLAIIHPYHSQRIKDQKGVFTVFPYYIPDVRMETLAKADKTKVYPAFGMEYMEECMPCLHNIQILNPDRVARELRLTGAKRGNLYSDMQVVSQDFEYAVN
ncbi:MAG: FRG domain-containing protein [Acetatifactor sp.]|nr:FRG domain-containing protein [Acetatifactor sp.]